MPKNSDFSSSYTQLFLVTKKIYDAIIQKMSSKGDLGELQELNENSPPPLIEDNKSKNMSIQTSSPVQAGVETQTQNPELNSTGIQHNPELSTSEVQTLAPTLSTESQTSDTTNLPRMNQTNTFSNANNQPQEVIPSKEIVKTMQAKKLDIPKIFNTESKSQSVDQTALTAPKKVMKEKKHQCEFCVKKFTSEYIHYLI